MMVLLSLNLLLSSLVFCQLLLTTLLMLLLLAVGKLLMAGTL